MLTFPPRDPAESHRNATPLELLFDLAAVVAIGAAAQELAAFTADGRAVDGVQGFLLSFFMVWWAWMNYTWFASAYDDGSTAFRGLSMVVMFGALMLAAGVDAVFAREPIWLALMGFLVMRGSWLAVLFAVIAFSLWSIYFTGGGHLHRDSLRLALLWGYGHVVVFGAGAAVGAGMQAVPLSEDGAAGRSRQRQRRQALNHS